MLIRIGKTIRTKVLEMTNIGIPIRRVWVRNIIFIIRLRIYHVIYSLTLDYEYF
jgi:hypothetical protein